ncbi:MAG: hypothetical protein V3T72_16690 [Thermoanaerobaculia bacterium]
MSTENSAAGTSRREPHPAGTSTRRPTADEVHELDRVRKATGELTAADLERLMVAAKTLLGGFRIDPQRRGHQDLLSSAIARTLSGERQWHQRVDFARHLFQTMRSIASHWRREALRAKLSPTLESLEDHPNLLDPRPDPEAALIIRETLEAIYKRFADDAAAKAVLACMAKGLTGSVIRDLTGMTQRQLATTVEKIRRYARRGKFDDV